MTTTTDNQFTLLLDELDLTDGIFEYGDTVPRFEVAGEVTTVEANQWVLQRETVQVGGREHNFNVRYRLVDPILSSIMLRHTRPQTGRYASNNTPEVRSDFNATVVTKRQLEVEINGQWIDIKTFLLQTIRSANPNLAKSDSDILLDLKGFGIMPDAALPMYIQHLGANNDAFYQIASDFQSRGARDNAPQVQARAEGQRSVVVASYRHNEGVPIASLDLSHADRRQSTTSATNGFIGFLDAYWNTFVRVMRFNKEYQIAAREVQRDPANLDASRKMSDIRRLFETSRTARAFRNWGGTNERNDIRNGTQYYAQQVPCGRFHIYTETGAPKQYSVWGTRASNGTSSELGTPAPSNAVINVPEIDSQAGDDTSGY